MGKVRARGRARIRKVVCLHFVVLFGFSQISRAWVPIRHSLLLEHAALLLHVLLLGHAHRLLLLPLLPRLPLLLPLMLQVLLLHVLAGGRGYQILHFVLSVVGLSGASRARDLMSRALAARKARRTPERLCRVSRENETRCLAKALRVR